MTFEFYKLEFKEVKIYGAPVEKLSAFKTWLYVNNISPTKIYNIGPDSFHAYFSPEKGKEVYKYLMENGWRHAF